MIIEDVIESLNKHIETKRLENGIKKDIGHLVLQKEILPHHTFKVYKNYRYTLWFIKNKKPYQVISFQQSHKVLKENEDDVTKKVDITFIELIFNWIGTNDYNKIIEGEYAYN